MGAELRVIRLSPLLRIIGIEEEVQQIALYPSVVAFGGIRDLQWSLDEIPYTGLKT